MDHMGLMNVREVGRADPLELRMREKARYEEGM